MQIRTLSPGILAFLLAGAALADGLPMQVDEPLDQALPPIVPSLDAGSWKARVSTSALNAQERAALEERRKQVEDMASRIREKREALENSGSEDRAARVKDLEGLVLDKDDAKGPGEVPDRRERFENRMEKRKAAQEKALERKREHLEKKLEKRLEKSLEKKKERPDKVKKDRKE
jgi:hypothetical protein